MKLPTSTEAEEAVIAACLTDPDVFAEVSAVLSASDISDHGLRMVYDAMVSLSRSDAPIDVISVTDELSKTDAINMVGGIGYVLNIRSLVESTANVMHHARIVRSKAELRGMIAAYNDGAMMASQESATADEIRSKVDEMINDQVSTASSIKSIRDSSDELMEYYRAIMANEDQADVIKTHLPDLDRGLGVGGVGLGEVMVIAAPTSCGKSALALNIALRACKYDNVPTAIVSLEMPQRQIANRMVQTISGVNIRKVRDGLASSIDMAKIEDATNELSAMNLVTTHVVKGPEDLASQVKSMVRRYGIKLLVIDYLQLVPYEGSSKAEGISKISHRIKQLALECNIAVLLLAQVNREGAKREHITLHDLKDSGDIENDADIVLLMWPEGGDVNKAKQNSPMGPYISLDYCIAKNREGERGILGRFFFYAQMGRFKQ